MHSRLFGLFLLVALVLFGAVSGFLLAGVYCTAIVLLLGFPILLLALWDHLATERRIREEWRARHVGFPLAPPEFTGGAVRDDDR